MILVKCERSGCPYPGRPSCNISKADVPQFSAHLAPGLRELPDLLGGPHAKRRRLNLLGVSR